MPRYAEASRGMTAGRKAHDRNGVGISMQLVSMGADIGDGSRDVLLRTRIAMRRVAIPDDEAVEAFRQKAERDRLGFAAAEIPITAAGTDHKSRPYPILS